MSRPPRIEIRAIRVPLIEIRAIRVIRVPSTEIRAIRAIRVPSIEIRAIRVPLMAIRVPSTSRP